FKQGIPACAGMTAQIANLQRFSIIKFSLQTDWALNSWAFNHRDFQTAKKFTYDSYRICYNCQSRYELPSYCKAVLPSGHFFLEVNSSFANICDNLFSCHIFDVGVNFVS
ncbi:MAG: hypothetical protein COZ21_09545, partial [Bacteroidetes bacterium CG_4_10_14_3_um_filter_31_20]